jgi:hypothetical protein
MGKLNYNLHSLTTCTALVRATASPGTTVTLVVSTSPAAESGAPAPGTAAKDTRTSLTPTAVLEMLYWKTPAGA